MYSCCVWQYEIQPDYVVRRCVENTTENAHRCDDVVDNENAVILLSSQPEISLCNFDLCNANITTNMTMNEMTTNSSVLDDMYLWSLAAKPIATILSSSASLIVLLCNWCLSRRSGWWRYTPPRLCSARLASTECVSVCHQALFCVPLVIRTVLISICLQRTSSVRFMHLRQNF